ncbi:hypothetical protein [Mesorhizobium sp. INR15]|uniref:hypothetical protein n=1 Tax=Mesorhizobium sp. INR15 TaxID=2654248 RepID=UPI00189687A5|nr:hypothetical protein [Mesorhizobium sp. INR15]QPC90024.1 hypothetical protein GA829_05145 [Mesorhizobium sp. INR15]
MSFTLSGTSAYPRQFHHSTNIGTGGRHFIGFQHRNLSDTTIPFLTDWPILRSLVDSWVFNKDGNFVFLCLFKVADDRESANGRIYAFERNVWREVRASFDAVLNELPASWDDETVLHDEFSQENLDKAGYSARFDIKRNGVTAIDTLSVAPDDRPEIRAERLEHAFAAQSYFCLRDLLHTHRFHSPSSDTIIDVYDDLDTLKRQVNFGLMRRALSARRVQTVEAQQRAIGIIAYLKAFRINVMSAADREALSFSLDETLAAINASIPLIAAKEFRSPKNALDRLRLKVIAGISIIFGYAALIKDSKVLVPQQLSWVRSLFTFIQERIGLALLSTVLLIWFIQVLLSLKNGKRDDILRNTSRVALAFRVRRFAIFEIVVATGMLTGALLLIAWIFETLLSGPAIPG